MIRALCLAGGLAGGMTLSQFPEFSQQYLQRLAGQVDALTVVVKDFDASALASGLGREDALEQLEGTAFLASRQADMRRTIARHARLVEDLILLRDASPLVRLTLPHRMADVETLRATWVDFTPAVPVTVAGAASAGTGFLGGWAVIAALFGLIISPMRRRPYAKNKAAARHEPAIRIEPPTTRPTLVTQTPGHIPKLAGAQR
ncbi:DUF2937 family protein [Yoonia sp.]|uniref:DUF2937 family protein n=1 Tax=Yoonia sp. TaxID=2212373 RepID=UPI0025F37016|nr:DUF2937 family protein [Yoonia sp.]